MSNKIDYRAFIVTKRKGKDDFWNGIGGAFKFTTEDGREGINIPSLNLVLLEPKPDEEEDATSQAA